VNSAKADPKACSRPRRRTSCGLTTARAIPQRRRGNSRGRNPHQL
jgi:hypothetical protein